MREARGERREAKEAIVGMDSSRRLLSRLQEGERSLEVDAKFEMNE